MAYSVYSEFDLEKHKKTFKNYLEIIIETDGTISYAVPSHIEKACAIACKTLNVSRAELEDLCPPEYYMAWMEWVLKQSGAIAVWQNGFCGPTPNKKQQAALRRLRISGVYTGPILKPNFR